jgi:hypothetical protein
MTYARYYNGNAKILFYILVKKDKKEKALALNTYAFLGKLQLGFIVFWRFSLSDCPDRSD